MVRKIGKYIVTYSVEIDDREIIFAQNPMDEDGYYYMVAEIIKDGNTEKYSARYTSEYLYGSLEDFANRIKKQIERATEEIEPENVTVLNEKDFLPLDKVDSLRNNVVVINPEKLLDDDTIKNQLFFVVDGGNVKDYSKDSDIYCYRIYDKAEHKIRFEDISGIIEAEQLPKWVKQRINTFPRKATYDEIQEYEKKDLHKRKQLYKKLNNLER